MISLLGTYAKEMIPLSQRDICTPMFIAALFIITKVWKQPKHPSVDKWIKMMKFSLKYEESCHS